MDVPTIVTIVTVVLSFATFFIGRMTAKHEEGKGAGELKADLNHIRQGVDEIKERQRDMETKEEQWHLDVVERLAEVEARSKSNTHRINKVEDEVKRAG